MDGFAIISKPRFGDPCNRCGECCKASMCEFGEQFLEVATVPCPALEIEPDGRTACGLMTHPSRHLRVQWTAPDKMSFDDFWRSQFGQLFTGRCSCPDEMLEEARHASDCGLCGDEK